MSKRFVAFQWWEQIDSISTGECNMKTTRFRVVAWLAATLVTSVVIVGFPTPSVRGQSPIGQKKGAGVDLGALEIKAAAKVDETLFLLRVLENTYQGWPRASDTGPNAARWAIDQKLLLKR